MSINMLFYFSNPAKGARLGHWTEKDGLSSRLDDWFGRKMCAATLTYLELAPPSLLPTGIPRTPKHAFHVSCVHVLFGNPKPCTFDDSTDVIYSLLQLTIHIGYNVIKLFASAHFATGRIDADQGTFEVFCLPGYKPFDQGPLVLCHNEYRDTIWNQLPNSFCALNVDPQDDVLAPVQGILDLRSHTCGRTKKSQQTQTAGNQSRHASH
eukprot:scaffold31_cov334-Pavlova_lutheri.AAC.7